MLGAAAQQTGGVLSTPSTTTTAPRSTRPAGSTTTPPWSTRVTGLFDTLPTLRHTLDAAELRRPRRRGRRQVPRGGPRLANAVAVVVHRRRSHRGGRTAATSTAGPSGWRRRRAGHPRRVPQPRRRRPGAVPHLPPRAGHRCIPRGVGDGLDAGAASAVSGDRRRARSATRQRSLVAHSQSNSPSRPRGRSTPRKMPLAGVVGDSASAARIIAAPVHVVRSTGQRLPSANTRPVQ